MNSQNSYLFISYASEDRKKVDCIKKFLEQAGFSVWRDRERLIGGQNFPQIIEKAFKNAAVILIFLSRRSVNKIGFFQKELKWAEKRLLDTAEGKISIVPILLDADVEVPAFLHNLHYLKRNDKKFKDGLTEAVRAAGCVSSADSLFPLSAKTPITRILSDRSKTPISNFSRSSSLENFVSAYLRGREQSKN